MPSVRPRLRSQSSSRARLVEVRNSHLRFVRYGSVKPRLDYSRSLEPDEAGVVPGVAGLMQFLSGVTISVSGTFYLNAQGVDSQLAEAQIPVPAGTAGKLVVEATQAPGSGKSFVYAVLKNGTATGLTVTLADLATKDSVAVDVAFSDEDDLALRLIVSAAASAAKHKCTLKYTPE